MENVYTSSQIRKEILVSKFYKIEKIFNFFMLQDNFKNKKIIIIFSRFGENF